MPEKMPTPDKEAWDKERLQEVLHALGNNKKTLMPKVEFQTLLKEHLDTTKSNDEESKQRIIDATTTWSETIGACFFNERAGYTEIVYIDSNGDLASVALKDEESKWFKSGSHASGQCLEEVLTKIGFTSCAGQDNGMGFISAVDAVLEKKLGESAQGAAEDAKAKFKF